MLLHHPKHDEPEIQSLSSEKVLLHYTYEDQDKQDEPKHLYMTYKDEDMIYDFVLKQLVNSSYLLEYHEKQQLYFQNSDEYLSRHLGMVFLLVMIWFLFYGLCICKHHNLNFWVLPMNNM